MLVAGTSAVTVSFRVMTVFFGVFWRQQPLVQIPAETILRTQRLIRHALEVEEVVLRLRALALLQPLLQPLLNLFFGFAPSTLQPRQNKTWTAATPEFLLPASLSPPRVSTSVTSRPSTSHAIPDEGRLCVPRAARSRVWQLVGLRHPPAPLLRRLQSRLCGFDGFARLNATPSPRL